MGVHRRSKGHILTPALKVIRQTRAERLLQWQAENKHENILFKDEKIFTIKEQYSHQNNKIYAQASLKVHSESAGRPSLFLCHGLVGGVPSRLTHDTSSFLQESGESGVQEYQEDVLHKRSCEISYHNPLQWSGMGSSSRTQFLPKRPRQLRSGCRGTFWPSSVPRIGYQGVQTSNPWTIKCGKFWKTLHVKSITTAWRSPVKAAEEIPLET